MIKVDDILTHHLLDHYYGPKLFGFLQISSNGIIMLGLVIGLCVLLPLLMRYKRPYIFYAAMQALVIFVRDSIVLPNCGEQGRKYTSYFCSLFLFILAAGSLGLVPGMRTVTGSISVTGGLALTSLALILYLGIKQMGVAGYLKHFVPAGTPLLLVPLLFFLEFIGVFTKSLVLAIRLFANMLAGHAVVICLIALIFVMGGMKAAAGYGTAAVSAGFALFINILELLVIFIQAYVFTLLTAIFAGEAFAHH